jgi:hypothetical protein
MIPISCISSTGYHSKPDSSMGVNCKNRSRGASSMDHTRCCYMRSNRPSKLQSSHRTLCSSPSGSSHRCHNYPEGISKTMSATRGSTWCAYDEISPIPRLPLLQLQEEGSTGTISQSLCLATIDHQCYVYLLQFHAHVHTTPLAARGIC